MTSAPPPPAELPGSPARGLRLRVLLPLAAATVAVVVAFVALFVREARRQRREDIARTATLVDDLLREQLADGVQVMSSIIELLQRDPALATALEARDRDTLMRISEPILQRIRARNHITHFYYILPDRTMLLRVQVPDEWGDRIDRFVLREAERTGKPFWGNEQGPFGSLTLRLSYPWEREGRRIGYLEMGIDIEDVMQSVHRLLDVDVFVAVEKRLLDRAKWDRMQKKLGRNVDWDEFPTLVVLSRTQAIPAPIAAYLHAPKNGYSRQTFEVSWPGRVSQAIVRPFVDLRGRELGETVVLRDITASARAARTTVLTVAGLCILVGGALLLLCYGLLGRVQRDVAQRTADLKASHARLQASNAELEQVVYVASHDLQEPLRTVGSYVQLLQRRHQGQLDADARAFLDYAGQGAERMQALLTDVVAYARVGTGGGPFAPTDCEAVLASALANLRARIEESDAHVTHSPLPMVIGDGAQLLELFQNLIGNALKYRRDVAPAVHVSADARDGMWCFSVRDNGVGIATEHFERVFVLFQRVGSGAQPGSGIGLAVCKKVVERHRGRIWVESTLGRGSTFYFTLPREGESAGQR